MRQIAAAVAAVVLLSLTALAFGRSPVELLNILITGSIGSRFAIEGTLLKSVLLLLTGLSVALAFRAGVWNIGGEGQFIVGAIAAIIASRFGAVAALAASVLAGGIELLGVTHRLFERFAAGYGYSGIAVALLAQLHPLGTIASAIFFGALVTGAGELQRTAGISSNVAIFGQAVVILVLILFGSWRARD